MLLADRFLPVRSGVIDLATGERVEFARLGVAARNVITAWDDTCAASHDPAWPLADYGVLPDGTRFEARRQARVAARASAHSINHSQIATHIGDVCDAARHGELRCLELLPSTTPDLEVVEAIARQARLRGFVPLSVDFVLRMLSGAAPVAAEIDNVLASRHLLLIEAGAATSEDVARLIVRVGAINPRPNILLTARNRNRNTATVFAERATPRWKPAMAVAEAHERYNVTAADLTRVGSRAVAAFDSLRVGRFRRAEYGMRELAGALARRNDSTGAGWVSINLGRLLLSRGHALDAARAFDSARLQFDRAGDVRGTIRATIYSALAWTDDDRLAEGEAAARAARIAAAEIGSSELEAEAAIALSRCFYWQGRFDEASVLVSSAIDRRARTGAPAHAPAVSVVRERSDVEEWGTPPEPDAGVRLHALAARIALARGDVRVALPSAVRSLELSRASGHQVDLCTAHTALAAVYAALNDTAQVVLHVGHGLAAARQSRSPLRALRLRLVAADALRADGSRGNHLRARLGRLDGTRFPSLLRRRIEIVLCADRELRTAVPACPWRQRPNAGNALDGIASLLQICHDSDDEEKALVKVCEALRGRLAALAVAVVGRERSTTFTIAQSGSGRADLKLAERSIDSGLAVSDAAPFGALEAAAPVRYCGSVVGVVAAHWAADATLECASATSLLSAAAAAVAPLVQCVIDRRLAPAESCRADDWQLVGSSQAMDDLRKAIRRAAAAPFPVLVEGESGSGKELVARAIHRESVRRARRFCALNCAALAEELIEAELFGHARGAFTGAVAERVGLFEEADGGTLFLDEVADLSARAQAKLLRAVQEGEVRRIGENIARRVDIRLIAATNRSLEQQVSAGAFRQDLFYRLKVVHISVPPLRERPEDIAALATHFWQRAVARTGSHATLGHEVLSALAHYDWPGNVRELENVMAAMAVSAPRRGSVAAACLPSAVAGCRVKAATLDEARREFERRFVRAVLAQTGGHRGNAASALGVSRQGLAKLMERLGIAEQGSR